MLSLSFDHLAESIQVHETFGPTYQPFYQVKFASTAPPDPEIVKPGRFVFHLPMRSNFVFPNQLKHLRGSDASNVHDEEVDGDELEFSDDEAEGAKGAIHVSGLS